MSEHAAHGAEAHEHAHHPDYVKIWAVLIVLLVASVIGPIVGEKLHLPILTLITAFGIAVVKAGLVIKNFMHLTAQKTFIIYAMITSVVFMLLLFAAVAPDVMNHEGHHWENVAAKSSIQQHLDEQKAAGGSHGGHEGGGH